MEGVINCNVVNEVWFRIEVKIFIICFFNDVFVLSLWVMEMVIGDEIVLGN